VRAIAAGDNGIRIEGPPLVLLLVGVALTSAVALVLVTRGWSTPRSATLAIVVATTVIWPLSGYAWLLAPLAFVLIGALLAHDRRQPTRTPPRLDALLVLGLGGAIFMLAGALTARPREEVRPPQPPVAALTAADDEAEAREDATREPGDAAEDDEDAGGADERAGDDEATRDGDEAAAGDDEATGDGDNAAEAADDEATRDGGDAAAANDEATRGGGDAAGDDTATGDDAAPTPAPASPRTPAPGASAPDVAPERFVRDYYADLNAQRFAEAWATLSPAVQAALGPYARWKAGYANTLSSQPQDFAVDGGSVTHVLVARDEGCGRSRQFRVSWQLVPDGDGWTVTRLTAAAVGPQGC
jgi:hypothetical protein